MRKVLIASAVALVLFATGAFAASFLVNSEDIASGEDDVLACADEVDVDFTTVYDGTLDDWTVDEAVLTFYVGGSVTGDCDGFGANLAVGTATADPAATGTGTVAGGTATITLDTQLLAADIDHAAVLVDGQVLNVPTPGEGFGP